MIENLWPIVVTSLKVAFFSSVLVMIFSCFMGLWLARNNSLGARIIEVLMYVPMIMPPVALGFLLLIMVGPKSAVGQLLSSWNMQIAFSFYGAILAAFMASLGIGIRSMRQAFLQFDWDSVAIARLHGANSYQVFLSIIFPLVWPNLLSGLILVFMRALGEFGATMILAGNTLGETRTLALAIWTDMQIPEKEQELWLLVLVAALLSFGALIMAEFLRVFFKFEKRAGP